MKPKILIPLLLLAITAIAPITAMAEDTDAYVAQIGDTKYTSLKEAVEAASSGDKITILKSYTTSENQIKIFSNITIDFNGQTITYEPKNGEAIIQVTGSVNLTIDDNGTKEGGIVCKSITTKKTFASFIYIAVDGTCVINGGTFSYDYPQKKATIINNRSSGNLIINGGTFSTSYAFNGTITNYGNTIINGGTINNTFDVNSTESINTKITAATSIHNMQGSIIVNGGIFNSNFYAIYVSDGNYSLSSSATYNRNCYINGSEALVLSDNVAFKDIATSATYPQISYTRTGAKTWGTVCLPFVPDEDESVSYYSLNKLDRTTGTIDVTEVSHDNMKANTPYLFFLNSSANGTYTAKAENVTLNNEQNPGSVSIDNWKLTGVYAETAVFAANTDKYKSTTSDKVVEPSAYYIKDNKICPINTYFRLKPYRAYFVMDSGDKGTGSNSYQVAILDELTGIGSAGNENEAKEIVGIYNLLGQKQSSLQKGINIVHYSDGTSKTINVSSR